MAVQGHRMSLILAPIDSAYATSVCFGSSASMIGWPATEQRQRKKQNSILFQRKNGYGMFLRNFYRTAEFYNGRTAKRQRKNGSGMVETGHKRR